MCGPLPWPNATSSKSLSQSRGDARRPKPLSLCYSTSKRDNGLAFDISVWGRSGESSRGRVRLNLFQWMWTFLIVPLVELVLTLLWPCLSFPPVSFTVSLLQFCIWLFFNVSFHATSPRTHIHTPLCLSPLTFPSVFPPVWGQACPSVLGTLTVSDG